MGTAVDGLPGHEMAHVGDARFYRGPGPLPLVTVRTLLDALAGRLSYDAARRTFVSRRRGPDAQRAAVGNAAHRMAACAALGRDAAPLAGEPPEAAAMARNIARELRSSAGRALAAERNMASERLGIGGTVDLVAEWRGRLAVIEHKTRRSIGEPTRHTRDPWPARRDDLLQAAAYAHMWSGAAGATPEALVVLVADSGSCVPVVREAAPWMREIAGERVARTVASMRELAAASPAYQSCA
ncbi:MAG: PD-(D/E)XK nuclease family protein [Thaumarchaeota archaeon]|nr:PD-(D/E)XK nuclease family protein [Nitrososphaerota archaeon]MDD9808235.1 PD-(D/E)XK nuclease family protein [Nitrososphaerota archaeon]MDD9814161.1 PD-(D/E)XK nuclease family protein [Nitrososphaerota archaeon]MDD9825927.1 PD-(D/E)XK nuclease family protein [Nitrososphaerota archaeon]